MNFKKNTLKLKKLTSAIKLYHLACAGLIAGQLAAPVAYAGPKGGHIRGGNGSISGDGSTQVTVDQLSQFLAIDWDSFNLGSEEKINFKQGFGDNSIALNRVIGNDLSTIAGEMNANGHVVLVNPNGVIFASGSSINVGALTASTLDIDPESFISAANAAENGNFEFTLGNYFKDNTASGSSYVVNHGNITASGSVSLIGNQVINTGMIKANLVHLTAADKAVLTFDDEGLIGVEITEEVKSNPKYEGFEDAVYNAGKIEGQQIFMEARVADDLFKYAVNNDGGTVIANGIEEKDGKIMLVGSGGSVANSGELTASGSEINISSDADIKLSNKSEIETDNLEMLAGGSFKNEGTIEVDQLNLKVGVNGQNTDNVLGNITARSGRIKGGIGSDKFTLGDEQDQLEIFGHKTFTLKNENISLTFNEVESVNTGGGTDSVIGADKMDWLLGGNGTAINSGIRFSGAEEFTATNAGLIGTEGQDAFVLTEEGDVKVDSLRFKGLNSVDGNAGDDSVDASEFAGGLALTGNTKEVLAGLIRFSNIESAVTNVLTGSDERDLFEVFSENAVKGNDIYFDISNMEEKVIATGGGNDSVIGADKMDWLLGGGATAINSGIRFSGAEEFTATNAGLIGTEGQDAFALTEEGDVKVDSLRFKGLNSVDGNAGNDSVDASEFAGGLALTGNTKEVLAGLIRFSNIESAVTNVLTGSDERDLFEVFSENAVKGNDIYFDISNMEEKVIATGGGNDSVIGADKMDWLLGGGATAINSGIRFSGAEEFTATNAGLIGTEGQDAFILTEEGDVKVDSLHFKGLNSVDGNAGDDSVDASEFAGGLALTGNTKEVLAGLIRFSNIESVVTNLLTGSDERDLFEVFSENAVKGNDIYFDISNMEEKVIATGGGNDSVIGADKMDWLLGGNGTAINSGIRFSGAEEFTATNAGLIGTEGQDAFALTEEGDVKVDNLRFKDLNSVDGNAGDDSVDASEFAGGLALTGNTKEVLAGLIRFSNIESAVTNVLTGSDERDLFEVFSENAVKGNDIYFDISNMEEKVIATGGGNDSVIGADKMDWLLGGGATAINSGIRFSGAEEFTATNAGLIGTEGQDAFALTEEGDVKVDNLRFKGLNSVDGNAGDDSVDASEFAGGLALTGKAKEVLAGLIRFSNIESAVTNVLTGSDERDLFEVFSENAVKGNDIYFDISNMEEKVIATGGGNDSVIGADKMDWLLGGNGTAINSGIRFSGAEEFTATNAGLIGTEGQDAFALTEEGDVKVDNLRFKGLNSVDGNAGDDSVDASEFAGGLALTGNTKEVLAGLIRFSNIESAVTSILRGSNKADSFNVQSANKLEAGAIEFSGVKTVNAEEGVDRVTGAGKADWLLGGNGTAINSGIRFSGAEEFTATNAGLIGTEGQDVFALTEEGDVKVDSLRFKGLNSVDGNAGDDSVDASEFAGGLALTGKAKEVLAGLMRFSNIESAVTNLLTGSDERDLFEVFSENAVKGNDIYFDISNMEEKAIATGGGNDSVTGADKMDWLLGGDATATNSGIRFSGAEEFTATNAGLIGTEGQDAFVLTEEGDVKVDSLRFKGLNSVDGNAGDDSVDASEFAGGLALTGKAKEVLAGLMRFSNIESAVTSILHGSNKADSFNVQSANKLEAGAIEFSGVKTVNAEEGVDRVTGATKADWLLGGNGTAINSGIRFSGAEEFTATNADLIGTEGQDVFALTEEGDVKVDSLRFKGLNSVDGNAGDDSVDASEFAGGLALTGNTKEVLAGLLKFSNIESAVTSILTGSANRDIFTLSGGEGAFSSAGVNFSGVTQVSGGGGTDQIQGSAKTESFELSRNGDIEVARITFEGVSEVAAGGGVDTVNADGALWTSTKGNDGLIDNSAEATVNGITVLFTELEKVMGTGVYSGQDIPSEYVFNDLDTMSIGGITFSGLTELIAGSARDVLYGSDIDAFWRLDALEGKITSGDSSIIFNGIESIIAGSGADNFELLGGDYASVDTGAGNDEVILAGTRVDSLSLGEGDDRLQVDADSAQSVKLSGGGGKDRFELNLEGKTWEIFAGLGGLNQVGNFQFSEFESLHNNVGNLSLNTNQKLAFVNGGDGPGARFGNGDMFLGFDGTKDVAVTSSGNETITGDLVARRAELNVAGKVDIGTEVGTLSILTTSGDIDVTVHAERDLEIGKIDAGRGTVQLTSGAFGNLTAEQAGGTHIKAGRATFGTASGPWGQIGTSINPLGLDVTESVAFYAGSIFDPKYIGQEPGVVTSVGDELQSTSSAQTAQGIKSAVQNATEDFTQVDPAIFEEVRPYSAGVNALYVPEMKLVDGVLVPVYSEENSEPDQAGHRETSTFPLESADASAVRYSLQSELQL